MAELHERLKTIEELRMKLSKISAGKSVNDPKVVSASQMLDARALAICRTEAQ
jgi:hypothetical protein